MSIALKLFEQLTETTDERERLRLIADAIGTLEDSWPRPADIARAGDVRESELRLQKEIEGVRKEIEVVRREIEVVRREIEVVRKEAAESEARLRKEIEQIRLETERVRGEIRGVETRLHQALHRQTIWIIGAVGAVVGLIRLLEYLLP
jgi:predicted  nucleic acid-binding Zn-ribbon protein